MVKRFRSLRIMSSFAFENSNGYLKNFVHGTNHPEFQIYSSTSLFLSYQTIKKNVFKATPQSKAYRFFSDVSNKNKIKQENKDYFAKKISKAA